MAHSRTDPAVIQRLVSLRRVDALRGVAPEALVGLASHASELVVRAGDRIAPGSCCAHFVVTGDISPVGRGPQRGALRQLPDLVSWLTDSAGVELVASTDSVVLRVETAGLETILQDNFGVFLAIARAVAAAVLDNRRRAASGSVLGSSNSHAPGHALRLIDRVQFLRKTLPFVTDHVAAAIQVARHADEWRPEPGTVLWREGDRSDVALFPLCGFAEAHLANGASLRFGAGSAFGGLDALVGGVRWYTAVAGPELLALAIPVERFLDVLEDNYELARAVLRTLARSLASGRAQLPQG